MTGTDRTHPMGGGVMSLRYLLGRTLPLAALLLVACGGKPEAATIETVPPSSASATASASAVAAPPSKPDPDRVMAHLKVLAGDIGVRAAGTDGERRAAEYIAQSLKDSGYQVAVEPFTFDLRYDTSAVRLTDGNVKALALTGSPEVEARGPLVAAGMGRPEDFGLRDVKGKVVVLDRGVVPFAQKAANAFGAGAVGVIVVNNEDGQFRGTLGDSKVTIPVVAVERSERARLMTLAQSGSVATVVSAAGSRQTPSQNVVGRNGDKCEVYLGAHYDSVPEGPGANDNASGSSMLLELARTQKRAGLCVVAFGAEEYGLWGSQAYIKQHGVAGIRFVLNFDMVAKVSGAQVVGDPALQEKILSMLKQAGKAGFRPGQFPPFATSDHASFVSAGVPAVTFYAGDDPQIHQPGDNLSNVDRASVETMLSAGELAINGLMSTR
ncbi:MAG: M28 family peptidase [Dehalococcoidia bacterium]|nr:MAG: M28 family peptidase [Dehalococcoidia bacterium]